MERYHATSVLSLTARHPARAGRTPGIGCNGAPSGPRLRLDFKRFSFGRAASLPLGARSLAIVGTLAGHYACSAPMKGMRQRYERSKKDRNRTTVHPGRKQEETPMTTQDSPSLYDRLGGVYSIATVIDDFIDRIMVDPRLNANPRVDEAHHRVAPAGFKYLVTEMVCWATGGPQKYTGRSMRESHQHLMITAAEWEAFLDDLQQTLDKFAVPQPEQAEIKAIVASTRADIVV